MSGPKDPFATVGEPEIISQSVIKQAYVDGCVHQIAIRRGTVFGFLGIAASSIPEDDVINAEICSVHNPWDLFDDDDNLYVSLWVAN